MASWTPHGRVKGWVKYSDSIDVEEGFQRVPSKDMIPCIYPCYLVSDLLHEDVAKGFEIPIPCRIKDGGEYRYSTLYFRKCAYGACKGDCGYCNELYKMTKCLI